MSLHIYRSPGQPLTRHDAGFNITDEPHWIEVNPRAQYWCHECGQKRWASKLSICVFYDHSYIFCTDGHEHPNGDRRRKVVPCRAVPSTGGASYKGE